MFTLSIEHGITDYPTWKGAFDRFESARDQAGVRGHRIRRPVDDQNYLLIELDFSTREQAERFRQFLFDVIWTNRDASPGLAGAPHARVIEPVAQARP